MAGCIITISREYGSGGRIIGQALAEQLKIPFYDRGLVEMISEKSGLSEKFINEAELYREEAIKYAGYDVTLQMPLTHVVFHAEAEVISKIANEGDCVSVGRCADYVLKDYQNCVNIYTYASFQTRVARAITDYAVDRDNGEKEVRKVDKAREAYYNYHTGNKWGDPNNYDVMLNMNYLSAEDAVKLIVEYLDLRKDDELRKPYNI